MDILQKFINNQQAFLLVFARIIGIIVAVPFFRDKMVFRNIKIMLAFLIAIIIYPNLQIEKIIEHNTFIIFSMSLTKEGIIGISIGMVAYLYYTVLYLSGFIIDLQMGFSMASVISPQEDGQIPLTANFFTLILVLVFLSTNAHHRVIRAMVDSFNYIPLESSLNGSVFLELMIKIFTGSFIIAFKIASPIIVSVFLANILLGILARTMPQMNVFVVGMPLKILVGLGVLVILLPTYMGVYSNIIEKMFESMYEFLTTLARGSA